MVLALSLLRPELRPALELTASFPSCRSALQPPLTPPRAIFLTGKPRHVTLLRWLPVALPLEAEGLATARSAGRPAPRHPRPPPLQRSE